MIVDIEDVWEFLEGIPPFSSEGSRAADFSLGRFRKFCAAIGDPQEQFPSIHVAGSNGKGSVCQIIASIYVQAGYNAGVFSSPHMMHYNERFTVNGVQIGEEDLIAFFQSHAALLKSFRLTYFEVSAAVAFWWFARRKVDVAVIETGLGGRLDATNIITPLASVITTITLDHTHILGDTIEVIAAEKAGIIKAGVPVVLGNVPDEAQRVIKGKAKEEHAEVFRSMDLHPAWREGNYLLSAKAGPMELQSTLCVPVQAYNIAAAWMLADVLQKSLPVTDIQREKGIQEVGILFSNIARFEQLHPKLQWYFDGAHNIQAVRAMKKMVGTIQPVEQSVFIFSLMRDKISREMMAELSEFKEIMYYTLSSARAATMRDIRSWLPAAQPFPDRQEARNRILKKFESELVLFGGSFYFYPTVRDWLSNFTIDQ
jgi:dihydrofolate synthase/folylpolyglutamate synthase